MLKELKSWLLILFCIKQWPIFYAQIYNSRACDPHRLSMDNICITGHTLGDYLKEEMFAKTSGMKHV